MGKTESLNRMVQNNLGYLKTSDATQAGISRTYLGEYVKSAGLERVAFGLYRAQDSWDDTMYVLQHRYPCAVFSHETALFLAGLAEREPSQYDVTLQTGAGSASLSRDGVRVHKVKAALIDRGLTDGQTPFGHVVRTYNIERTICDLVRNRKSVDAQELQSALKAFVRIKSKDIPLLMRYARAFSIDKILAQYLELLL